MTAPETHSYFTPDRFRHEYGRLVGWLTYRYGRSLSRETGGAGEALEQAQDIAQDTLLAAMRSWPQHGLPDNPAAWLTRAARNRAIDLIRHRSTAVSADYSSTVTEQSEPVFGDEIADDMLQLLFLCCHPSLTADAQIALTLHIAAGFSASEIARAFLADERTIAQRIVRAKRELRDKQVPILTPVGSELNERTESVLKALYLLFNEGYLSASGDQLTRPEICREAERLMSLLAQHHMILRSDDLSSTVCAVMALMHFQLARLPARVSNSGALVILEEQDRTLYDNTLIQAGFRWMEKAKTGTRLTSYHLEAVILSCHVRSASLPQTDWRTIIECYETLMAIAPSPVVRLNWVVALSHFHGPQATLDELQKLATEPSLARFHLFHAVHGELLRKMKKDAQARAAFERALNLTENKREQEFLKRRLTELER